MRVGADAIRLMLRRPQLPVVCLAFTVVSSVFRVCYTASSAQWGSYKSVIEIQKRNRSHDTAGPYPSWRRDQISDARRPAASVVVTRAGQVRV